MERGGRFLFAFHSSKEGYEYAVQLALAINLAVTALVILLLFLFTRHLLKPIRQLDEGVRTLAGGQMNLQLASRRSDELGKLVNSFAAMTGRIREMLAARDRLLLDVSHELRSPLTRIKLSLEMMGACPERREIAADIHDMETMVSELLETERLQSPHGDLDLEAFPLSRLLEDLVQEFGGQQPGLTVLQSEVIDMVADWKRLRRLLANLLTNAVKYAEKPGEPIRLTATRVGDRLRLTIENRGAPIPEADLALVFEPFYRVDKSRTKATGGYGLGLSLARRIAQAHGGSLVLENVDGLGVRSILELPLPW